MDISTQARIGLFILSIILFISTALHLLFPTWKGFCNKNTREVLSEKDALRYEKKCSYGAILLGLFPLLAAIPSVSPSRKSMVLFMFIGIFLFLCYQVYLNYQFLGTFSAPHSSRIKRFRWLRLLIYFLIMFVLFIFFLPYNGLNLFVKAGVVTLAAAIGSKFVNG